MEINLHRDITHTEYKAKVLFEKGEESWLRKVIIDKPQGLKNDGVHIMNDEYFVMPSASHILPLWGGVLV